MRKPLHIDDPADLQYVRQILRAPLDPYGFEFDWGEGPRPAIRNYHPPLKFYYHAAIVALVPWEGDPFRSTAIEEVLHLSYLPFVLITVYAVRELCTYFGAPLWPVLVLWLFGPGYLPGQNAMLDVPAVALGLATAALLVRYFRQRRLTIAVVAGVCLALGVMTKYSVALVWGVAVVWLWWERAGWRAAALVLMPAVVAVALWAAVSYAAYGVVHPLMVLWGVPGQVGAHRPGAVNLIDSLVFLGGAVPAVVVFLALRGLKELLLLLGSVAAALGLYVLRRPELNVVGNLRDLAPENLVWWLILATAGAALAGATLVEGLRLGGGASVPARQRGIAVLWFWLALVLGSAAAPFVAMRRVLEPALLGTILLMAQASNPSRPLARRWLHAFVMPVTLVLNLALGYTAAISDYELATVYPKYANMIARDQLQFTNQAWCYGYWGWMFYAERNGLRRYVPGREQPRDGDMFVWLDVVAKPAVIPEELRSRLRHLFKEYERGSAPLKIMSKQAGAGYYSNVWGPLPYAWSQIPIEVLNAAVVKDRAPAAEADEAL